MSHTAPQSQIFSVICVSYIVLSTGVKQPDHQQQDLVGVMSVCVCLALPSYYIYIKEPQSCLQVSIKPPVSSAT